MDNININWYPGHMAKTKEANIRRFKTNRCSSRKY